MVMSLMMLSDNSYSMNLTFSVPPARWIAMMILLKWVPAQQAWNSLGELLSTCLVKVKDLTSTRPVVAPPALLAVRETFCEAPALNPVTSIHPECLLSELSPSMSSILTNVSNDITMLLSCSIITVHADGRRWTYPAWNCLR